MEYEAVMQMEVTYVATGKENVYIAHIEILEQFTCRDHNYDVHDNM